MAQSFDSVEEYLASLPDDRRQALEAVRAVVLANLPDGLEEGIQYNIIGYYVPHSRYPDGYHCDPKQPLPFLHLANQKHHLGIYAFCVYTHEPTKAWFAENIMQPGKRLDMGASCLRFKRVEDLRLETVAELLQQISVEKFIAEYEANLPASKRKKK